MGIVDELAKARTAFEQQDWDGVWAALGDHDIASLSVDDFERLAEAAFLSGRTDECARLLQQAWHVYAEAGRAPEAARVAFWLALALLERGDLAVVRGWVGRARRLLEDLRQMLPGRFGDCQHGAPPLLLT